ncbi:hypothetical protein [Streptomyces formicae]|uniref:Uncharacterized protein n=1 Tax=Streptomyces formicae TaxID=1616117 RepID=A0ABY3WSN7_9ACTN|nr:hypothetical protein [Streptomyces formicae]UNM13827.1 hypothetical protein J4032_22295 [Streptomyces formicae]
MTAADLSRVDVPAAQVAAEFAALKAKRTTDALLAEQRHLVDPVDTVFAATAAAHPEACSSSSGDPQWDAWLATRITETRAAWAAHHAGGTA